MKKEFFGLLCGCTLLPAFLHAQTERPNIVIVLADDLGWGDVGFHGSEIKTPCLDALVGEGVELERFYTSPISTPTRAGLMTGRYPNRFGVRSAVIPPWREDGLDENETSKRYMHHYNFPPYSVGEARAPRSPGRREIGHGALAERALVPVIPSVEEFPYAIRLVSEVLSLSLIHI